MHDSRTGLYALTKRELIERLLAEMEPWTGEGPLPAECRARAEDVLDVLFDCPLWLAETHWHALCGLCLERSSRPDTWLPEVLFTTLRNWQRYLAADGYQADAFPSPRPIPRPPLPEIPPSEPGHLPFGFVKPMTG